jgi:uncharacterized membrane protein HdeD (DUF308 family)
MNNALVRSWWALALRGAAGILFAVLALLLPGLTLLSLGALFAAYALLGGFASVAAAVQHRHVDEDWWLLALVGIASIGAGLIASISPSLTSLVLVLVIAANALVTGVLDIVSAVRLRNEVRGEVLLGLTGLVSIAFGVIVFLFPLSGAMAMIWLISMYAFINGVLLVGLSFRAHALTRGLAPRLGERRQGMDRRISPAV